MTEAVGDENLEWLYGDENDKQDSEEEVKMATALSCPLSAPTTVETIGSGLDSQAPSPQHIATGSSPVNLNMDFSSHRNYEAVTQAKMRGVDLNALGSINGVPVLEVDMESFEEKPWRKPGTDLSDFFNFGLNEDTWKLYCAEQQRRPMGMNGTNASSNTSRLMLKRKENPLKDVINITPLKAKSEIGTTTNIPKHEINPTRKSATIEVIGPQTASVTQVISGPRPSDSKPPPAKLPTDQDLSTPPASLLPLDQGLYIPPTPFLPPLCRTVSPPKAPTCETQDGGKQVAKLTAAVSAVTLTPVMEETNGNRVHCQETLADEEDSESDDELQVTIGYIKTPSSENMTCASRPVDDKLEVCRHLEGDTGEKAEVKLAEAVSALPPRHVTVETIRSGMDSHETLSDESDSDDDNLHITIGNIKSPAELEMTGGATSAGSNVKSVTQRVRGRVSCNVTSPEFDGSLSVHGILEHEVNHRRSPEENKDVPWRHPGADLSDHFNYGFNEETWKAYNEKQLRLRRQFLKVPINIIAREVVQWKENTEKDVNVSVHTAKSRFSNSTNILKSGLNTRVSPPQWTGPANHDMPYYYTSGYPAGYDARSVSSYTFPAGGYPFQTPGAAVSWATMVDHSTPCECYPPSKKNQEKERECGQSRRLALQERNRQQELEDGLVAISLSREVACFEHSDYSTRGYERYHEQSCQVKDERLRERRFRDKEEKAIKSPKSSGYPGGFSAPSILPHAFPEVLIPGTDHQPWSNKEGGKGGEPLKEQDVKEERELDPGHSLPAKAHTSIKYNDDQHQTKHVREGKDQSVDQDGKELPNEPTHLVCSF